MKKLRRQGRMHCVMGALLVFVATAAFPAERVSGVVKAQTLLASDSVHPGSAVRLAVLAQIALGFHINDHHPSLDYLIPTQVTFDNFAGLKAGQVVYPKGRLRKFAFVDSPISVYEGEIRIGAKFEVARSLRPGTYNLHGKLSYQACNDHACLAPVSIPLEAVIRVVRNGVPVKPLHSEVFEKIDFN